MALMAFRGATRISWHLKGPVTRGAGPAHGHLATLSCCVFNPHETLETHQQRNRGTRRVHGGDSFHRSASISAQRFSVPRRVSMNNDDSVLQPAAETIPNLADALTS